jgi:hypothetical protein
MTLLILKRGDELNWKGVVVYFKCSKSSYYIN